jgi:UDP-N-acetyl-2-amino-2-deoxyglucuronate dehydrogenase
MSATLNFAIIGCGHIAAKHAQGIASLPDARLAAITDADRGRALAFQERFGGKLYSSLEELLAHADVDIVCICTPSGMHAAQGFACARAGKHIVMEKPMALSLAEADRLLEACRERGVQLTVVHPNRFLPPVHHLFAALESGRFGRISHAAATLRWNRNQEYYEDVSWRGTWSQDGGVLYNQAYHILDLLLWLMGPVESAAAYNATRLHKIEVPDISTGIVKFTSGALGVIEATTNVYPTNLEESLYIFGERGTAAVGGRKMTAITHWEFADLSPEEAQQEMEAINAETALPGHTQILAAMAEAVRSDSEPPVSGAEGRRVLELIEKLSPVPINQSTLLL